MKILVTGSAGFIGFHLTKKLLKLGHSVFGIDNMNDYYDVNLKRLRLSLLEDSKNSDKFNFEQVDICDKKAINLIFDNNKFDTVINLAAQAGVRYSIDFPEKYISSNIMGFLNILESLKDNSNSHLIFASSSSVYGMNKKQPFDVSDNTDFPISVYAASKKSNELLAHAYSHLFGLRATGIRFFTVYGPYGRPDMAYFKFTKAISNGEEIDLYNSGKMKRDFTYIDDIVDGLVRITENPPNILKSDITNSNAPFRILNIGNNNPVTLDRFIKAIESSLQKKAKKRLLPMQEGDVPLTYANIDSIIDEYDFAPSTSIEEGIQKFVDWYKDYTN